jgi:hypothetical protein
LAEVFTERMAHEPIRKDNPRRQKGVIIVASPKLALCFGTRTAGGNPGVMEDYPPLQLSWVAILLDQAGKVASRTSYNERRFRADVNFVFAAQRYLA